MEKNNENILQNISTDVPQMETVQQWYSNLAREIRFPAEFIIKHTWAC